MRVIRTAGVALASFLLVVSAAAQGGGGIFVTPIPGAPFSAVVEVERTDLRTNGAVLQLRSQWQVARDGAGRIHNEFRPFTPAAIAQAPPVTRIHLYDPQNRMSEELFPLRKTFQATVLSRPPATDTPDDFASASSVSAQGSEFTHREELGAREIEGLPTRGVRITQTLPAARSGTGKDVLVTNEYWYSEALRLNLLTRHDDPRTGSVVTSVVQITRSEPDAALFEVPSSYTMNGFGGRAGSQPANLK